MIVLWQVQGFPTIKYFPAGSKDGPQEYDGGRTTDDIVNWALEKLADNIAPPEIKEVKSLVLAFLAKSSSFLLFEMYFVVLACLFLSKMLCTNKVYQTFCSDKHK